jgi:hypothetical protein
VLDDVDRAQQAAFDAVCDRVSASLGRETRKRGPRASGPGPRPEVARDTLVDAVPAITESGDTMRGAAPAPEMPAPAPAATAAPVPVVPATDVTAPLGLANKLEEAHGAELAIPRTTTGSTPSSEEVDGGWDLGEEDPTAPTSPPSASEMAGDGATGGDGVTDDPGWD